MIEEEEDRKEEEASCGGGVHMNERCGLRVPHVKACHAQLRKN